MLLEQRSLSHLSDLDILELIARNESRASFWAFRQFMNTKMKLGWWQAHAAAHLQQFYDDMLAGKRPVLVIEAPPQHGKSETIVDFIAWVSGKHPDWKTIYGSFSSRLGKRANKKLQRMMISRRYDSVFPGTRIAVTGDGGTDRTIKSQEMIEFVGREGSFRNTTVLGSVTGESLDLGVIDDPIKGRKEANSETIRDGTWDWFTDDFYTRFSDEAGLLIILTRWHLDDPVGRMKEIFPDMKVLQYKAIATADEDHRKAGEPLFPEHKSLDFLLKRKTALGTASFEALYQQNPIALGGNIIRGGWFVRIPLPPKIHHRMMFADTAMKTGEHNDYSVLQVWGLLDNKRIILLDMIRGKWEAPELKRRTIEFWQKHRDPALTATMGHLRMLKVEDKASGTGLIQDLKVNSGIPVKGIERNKDKLTRVQDVVSFIEAGYVCLLEDAPWISDLITECEAFTADDSHAHDDQIDPMCDAICDLIGPRPRGFFS